MVTSDSDLVVSWLGNMVLKRADIHDQDVASRVASQSLEHHSLADLAIPPELLIIQLGVKAAANRETPAVLEEVLRSRHAEGKSTWVFDQPNRLYMAGHMAFSHDVEEFMEVHYERVILPSVGKSGTTTASPSPTKSPSGRVTAPPVFSLSDLSGGGSGSTELRKPRRKVKK